MSKKRIVIICVAAVLLIGGIIVIPKIGLFLKSRIESVNEKQVAFFIKEKTTAEQLASALKEAGIIDNIDAFQDVAEYKGLDESKIALGKYMIDPKTQYRNLLNGFTLNDAGNGNAEVEVDVTFNNCRDIQQIAGKVSKSIMLDSTALVKLLMDQKILNKYGFTPQQLPAMFIPNTYKLYFDTDESAFVDRMAMEFKMFWTADRMMKLQEVGLKSPSEAVTLASVVYSEQSVITDEWPVIAGLYLNRIEQGILLQSDPTFKFCWGDELNGVQRLLYVHRDRDCPYNTYLYKGLPPGPICVPPAAVVDAVLNPTKHEYIFMMAKPDFSKRHDFAKDYATHQRYAKIYQKWLTTLN
jgi:UPF0755 protein